MGQVEPAIAAEPLDVSKINQLKRSLEDKLQSLSDLDQGILELTPEDLIVTEIVQADEIRERLYAALSKLELCLSPTIPHGRAHTTDPPTTDPPAVDPPATDPSTTDPPAVDPPATHPPAADLPATDPPDPAASGTTHGPNVKLPKISLPRFNGNPVKWDSFQSAIHLNPELSDVDKFSYLRPSLMAQPTMPSLGSPPIISKWSRSVMEILVLRKFWSGGPTFQENRSPRTKIF